MVSSYLCSRRVLRNVDRKNASGQGQNALRQPIKNRVKNVVKSRRRGLSGGSSTRIMHKRGRRRVLQSGHTRLLAAQRGRLACVRSHTCCPSNSYNGQDTNGQDYGTKTPTMGVWPRVASLVRIQHGGPPIEYCRF